MAHRGTSITMQQLPNLKNSDKLWPKLLIAAVLVIFAVSFRILPSPANFAPIAAVAIFGAAILPLNWALALPLLAMITSDIFIGMHSLVFLTWGSYLIIALMGSKYLKKLNLGRIITTSLSASLLFYIITNFGVWAEGRLYPLTAQGLFGSYYNAIPFFRNTVVSDLFFSALLFGAYYLVGHFVLRKIPSKIADNSTSTSVKI
jgi:hypothetical protein